MTRRAIAVGLVVLVALAGCTVDVTIDSGTPTTSGGATPTPTVGDGRTATVVDVVDGDTLDVRFADGTEERVRLLGVDTPEVYGGVSPNEFGIPDTEAGRTCLRNWADRASQYATERLAGATVTVTVDPLADRRGSYGRLLAYVTVDGKSFNYDLLANGYARVYVTEFSRLDAFQRAANQAQANDSGLWACAS